MMNDNMYEWQHVLEIWDVEVTEDKINKAYVTQLPKAKRREYHYLLQLDKAYMDALSWLNRKDVL